MDKFELIICIVNEGFAEEVMRVARENGAKGGTILNGRGTASSEAETMFNITVTPEKEMVFILVAEKVKDQILHGIYQKCGLSSPGQGIAFTVPVEETVGLDAITTKFDEKPTKE